MLKSLSEMFFAEVAFSERSWLVSCAVGLLCSLWLAGNAVDARCDGAKVSALARGSGTFVRWIRESRHLGIFRWWGGFAILNICSLTLDRREL